MLKHEHRRMTRRALHTPITLHTDLRFTSLFRSNDAPLFAMSPHMQSCLRHTSGTFHTTGRNRLHAAQSAGARERPVRRRKTINELTEWL